MPLTQQPPTALPPPCPHLALLRMTSLATRQDTKKFNKPLSFDTSSVMDMSSMFRVPSSPSLQPVPSLHAANIAAAHRPAASLPAPRLASYDLPCDLAGR
eukprot:scaffold110720_cov36-Phaeocystis_antarctica.AAC.2